MKKKNLYKIIITASLIGILVASYLVSMIYSNNGIVCVVGDNTSCNVVSIGIYSRLIFNIPNSLIGVIGFIAFLILGYLGIKNKKVEKMFLVSSSLAMAFILYLAYLVFFILKSFCIWCFISWIIVTVVFVCSILLKKY
jgi:uncharacterized membrane protein